MRLHEKVSCVDCRHYTDCSDRTRLFVNYCGSRGQDFETLIEKATKECLAKRGRMFKRVILSPVVQTNPIKNPLGFSTT